MSHWWTFCAAHLWSNQIFFSNFIRGLIFFARKPASFFYQKRSNLMLLQYFFLMNFKALLKKLIKKMYIAINPIPMEYKSLVIQGLLKDIRICIPVRLNFFNGIGYKECKKLPKPFPYPKEGLKSFKYFFFGASPWFWGLNSSNCRCSSAFCQMPLLSSSMCTGLFWRNPWSYLRRNP